MHRWTIHLLGCLLLIGVGLILAPALRQGFDRVRATIPNPSPDDGLEGTLVFEANLVRRGEALYRPVVPEEFVSAPYTPGYTMAMAVLPFNPDRPFTAGRTISLVAMLVVALGVAAFVGGHTRFWWLGGVAALLWLSFAPTQLWATRVKPDALALACIMVGLLLASIQHGRFAHWAAVAFALAFLTKQTALIAPVAVGLNLLMSDWRRAARYALAYGLAVGLPYLALDLATDGWASAHIWGLHQSEWWRLALVWKYVELLVWSLPLAGLTLLALPNAREDFGYRQALLYALLAPMTLYGAGEIGAHHNHLLETMLAWTLAGGVGLGLVMQSWASGGWPWRMASGAALVGLLMQANFLRTTPQWYRGEFFPASLERFVPYIQSKPGEVLADNVGLLVRAGKRVRFDDPSTMGPAIQSGLWDPSALHAAIANHEFDLILLDVDLDTETTDAAGRWTDETLRLIKQYYTLEFRDTINSYVPKG